MLLTTLFSMPKRRLTIIPGKSPLQQKAAKERQEQQMEGEDSTEMFTRRTVHATYVRQWRQTTTIRPLRQQQFLARQFPPKVNPFSLGNMDNICNLCQALKFRGENHNCCHGGKVQLPPLAPYPQQMKELLTLNTAQSCNFREHIRRYNSSVAFASFGANIISPLGRGLYAFRLHGQIYHRSGLLHSPHGTTPSYSQLYIMEGQQAVDTRLQQTANEPYRRDNMTLLTTILNRINPYAAAYKKMHEVEQAENRRANENNAPPSTVTMVILRGSDQRRYNNPRQDEIAVVFSSDDGAPPQERDIVVHPKDQQPPKISYLSANIDPMAYPIFFPNGDLGWTYEMQHHLNHSTATRTTVHSSSFQPNLSRQ
jgi:hypothetical protein